MEDEVVVGIVESELRAYPYLSILADAVGRLPDGAQIVELGCWWGKATSVMVNASNETQMVFAVDHFGGTNSGAEKYNFDRFRELREAQGVATDKEMFRLVMGQRVTKDFTVVEGEFDHAAPTFKDDSIDFLFVDGDHTQTTHDLITWYPKVKTGGIVYCHDVGAKGFTVGEELRMFCEFHDLCWDMDGELGWFRKGERND